MTRQGRLRRSRVAEEFVGAASLVVNLGQLGTQPGPYVFEGTSFDIWTRIDGTRTEAQIVDELTGVYQGTRAEIAGDVRAFVGQLLALDLAQIG